MTLCPAGNTDSSSKISNGIYIFSIASLILILDRITKIIIKGRLLQGESRIILPNLFHITLVLNKGAAFGLFKDQRIFFVSLSCLTILFIIIYIRRNDLKCISSSLALGLILGGAAGNLIDRIRFGYVIDFLDFRIWPVFNVADSSITIGAVMLLCNILRQKLPPSNAITKI